MAKSGGILAGFQVGNSKRRIISVTAVKLADREGYHGDACEGLTGPLSVVMVAQKLDKFDVAAAISGTQKGANELS